jgi:hypothetical protein
MLDAFRIENSRIPAFVTNFPSNVSQIFDTRLKILNLKLSANRNARRNANAVRQKLMLGKLMPAFGNAQNFAIW